MRLSSREEIVEVLDALDAAVDGACELSFDALTTPERLRLLQRLEQVARRLTVPSHALINQLAEQSDEPSSVAGWPGHWPTYCTSPAGGNSAGGRSRRTLVSGGR